MKKKFPAELIVYWEEDNGSDDGGYWVVTAINDIATIGEVKRVGVYKLGRQLDVSAKPEIKQVVR